jgi:hypothetical protein
MRARCHILAAVLALAGHLVGAAGLPLPSPAAESVPPVAKPAKKCCCACGGGCGEVCCCCGGTAEPAGDEPVADDSGWHWVPTVQVQKCYGAGPSGLPDLPPSLPVVRTITRLHNAAAAEFVVPRPAIATSLTVSPPTPPPRGS